MPSIAFAAVRVRGRGTSGQDFRNNTAVRDKTIFRNQPVEPPKTGIPRSASAGRAAGIWALSPPHPHTMGLYGFGGEKRNRTVNRREEKQATLKHALGRAVIVPVTNSMINGQEWEARGDRTSVPGWLRDSRAVSHPGAGPRTSNCWKGSEGEGDGARNQPQPCRSFVPRYADGPRTAAPASVGFSFFVVRVFLFPPFASHGGREGAPSAQSPSLRRDPPISGHPGLQSRSRGGTRGTARAPQPRRPNPGGGARTPQAPPDLPARPAHLPAVPAGSG